VTVPETGCVSPSWFLKITSNSNLANQSRSASDPIPASAMSLSSTNYSNGVTGTVVESTDSSSWIPLGGPVQLVQGSASTPSFEATLGFTINPPETADIGIYEGEITIEISSTFP